MNRGPEYANYAPQSHEGNPLAELKDVPSIIIRPYEDRDCDAVVAIAHQNFITHYSVLYPKDVVDAYKAANRAVDLRSAISQDGSEGWVTVTADGEIAAFSLLRYTDYTRRDPQGELEIRRYHVNLNKQKQKIGTKGFAHIEERGRQIGVELLVSHASGSSRLFFEGAGFTGRTELSEMRKRSTSALVFAAQKRIAPEVVRLYEQPTHIVYAGENSVKEQYVRELVTAIDPAISVISLSTEEDPTEDVYEAAKSKAYGIRLTTSKNVRPLIVAGDIRTELLVLDSQSHTRYKLVNRGKPRSADPLEEIRQNFILLRDYSRATRKPAPYIVRSATYLRDPNNPEEDSYSEQDTSVWLSREALETLSTEPGLADFRAEVYDSYGVDITKMAAGFALPVFLKRGHVEGLNGHPFASLPKADEVIQKSLHTVIQGIDPKLVKLRCGVVE